MVSLLFLAAVASILFLDCSMRSFSYYLKLVAISVIANEVPSLELATSSKVKAKEVIKLEL